jgi:hypothetical protein
MRPKASRPFQSYVVVRLAEGANPAVYEVPARSIWREISSTVDGIVVPLSGMRMRFSAV